MTSIFKRKVPIVPTSVEITLLIDEVENKVLFVQAGKDFVDVLLSFLVLPLGTIARLVSKESVNIGSISTLYESVANLDNDYFSAPAYKEMLIKPRNVMEEYCQNMKLNIDDTEKSIFFKCPSRKCFNGQEDGSKKYFAKFKNQMCKCGLRITWEMYFRIFDSNNGFVPVAATFMISDDLTVKPDNFGGTITKPKHLGLDGFDSIKQLTMNVTKKEMLELLKWSLVSETPLTNVFLLKKQFDENTQKISQFYFGIGGDQHNEEIGEENDKVNKTVNVRKSTNTILFALGEDDFADFILSFLTLPMVGVEHMLKGNSKMGSIDSLYQSFLDLGPSKYLRSFELDEILKLFRLSHKIFRVDHLTPLNYYYVSKLVRNEDDIEIESGYITSRTKYNLCNNQERVPLKYLEPYGYKHFVGRGTFMKSPSLYMVTDDLVVAPGSSAATISFITKLGIPTYDLEERVINIGKDEGLSLMKAFLTSSSALTNGLGPFLGII